MSDIKEKEIRGWETRGWDHILAEGWWGSKLCWCVGVRVEGVGWEWRIVINWEDGWLDIGGRKKERGNDDFWSEHNENGDPWTEIGKAKLVADLIFAVGDLLACHLSPSPWPSAAGWLHTVLPLTRVFAGPILNGCEPFENHEINPSFISSPLQSPILPALTAHWINNECVSEC